MASIQSYLLRFLIKKTVNWNRPLNEIREFQKNIEKKEVIPPGIQIEKISLNGIESEWFIPRDSSRERTLIYLHGGGYCLGIVNANRNFVLKLSAEFGVPIVLLNYSLAPEKPFPAALNDSVSLYKWLMNDLKISSENIGYIADSSGCGLTLATLQILKKERITLPNCQIFMSPVVDLKRLGQSFMTKADKDPFNIKDEYFIDNNYLIGNDPSDPLISPIYGDLTDISQTLIQASEYDVFYSDSIILQHKLLNSNVIVNLKMWPKMWHVFQMSYGVLPEGKRAIREIKQFIHESYLQQPTQGL
jgi:acetyl esterase/lipase